MIKLNLILAIMISLIFLISAFVFYYRCRYKDAMIMTGFSVAVILTADLVHTLSKCIIEGM